MRPVGIALLLALTTIAGCLESGDPDGFVPGLPDAPAIVRDPQWAVDALPLGHNHQDPTQHKNLSSRNFEVIGHDPLVTDLHGAPAGGYFCGEVSTGEQRLAVVNSFTSDTAIVIVDVTDPNDPTMLGELSLTRTHIYDSAISDDGRYAILATSPLEPLAHGDGGPVPDAAKTAATMPTKRSITPTWRDACGNTYQGPEDEAPYDSGVILVDLVDPTAPTIADYVPQPALGPHSVQATDIDSTQWVVASTTNLQYTASFFSFFTIEANPITGGKLVPYGEYSANYENVESPNDLLLLNGHVDATIQKHPVTGDLIAYLANWDEGFQVVRLDGPGQITHLATWGKRDPSQGSGMTGQIHTAYPLGEIWNGRHITITGQELGSRPAGRPTGQIVLLDTTDPASPTPVARWTIPVDISWSGGLLFSTHYVAFQDETLYTALYHGGVWAADASEEQWPELPSIGVFIPDAETPAEPATSAEFPEVLDVLPLGNNTILTFDGPTGAYTVRLNPDPALPMAAPWTQDAWIGQ